VESYHRYDAGQACRTRISDGSEDHEFADHNQSRQVIEAAEVRGAEYGLFDRIEPPHADPASGLVLDTTPERPDGSEMHDPNRLADGWYLDRYFSKREARTAIEHLVEIVGLDAAFDGQWESIGDSVESPG